MVHFNGAFNPRKALIRVKNPRDYSTGQITDVMAQDPVVENRIKDLMDALIRGLLVEQTFLGKEFMGVATL